MQSPLRIGLLPLDAGPRLPLAAIHDALQAANALLGEPHYQVVELDAAQSDTAPQAPASHWAGLFVAASRLPAADDVVPEGLRAQLAYLDPAHGVLGGIGMGTAWLARAGWMAGRRCTIQAEGTDALIARHPDCVVTRGLYEIDGTRMSAAGGTASLDMAITWLGARHGQRIVPQLAACFGLDRLRAPDDRQPSGVLPGLRLPPKLAEAVALMQANIAEPLSSDHIAGLVGVSRRQLERLFRQYMESLPSRWYLEQRLTRAQLLLRQSSQSILQIGLSCGFTSGAHFSNAYRGYFGRTPREERTPRAIPPHVAADPAAAGDPSLAPNRHD
jgi:transcriptional regulator GlxA family with amidase domain